MNFEDVGLTPISVVPVLSYPLDLEPQTPAPVNWVTVEESKLSG